MDQYLADITEFIVELASTILSFFKGTDVELNEEQVSGIKYFISLILGA